MRNEPRQSSPMPLHTRRTCSIPPQDLCSSRGRGFDRRKFRPPSTSSPTPLAMRHILPYKDCVSIREELSDDSTEYKLYALGVGTVKEIESDGAVSLKSHTTIEAAP